MNEKDRASIFDFEEQAVRLVSHCLEATIDFQCIPDEVLNARYEEQLASCFHDHPFLAGRHFRNAIFEAIAVCLLITSGKSHYYDLALTYVDRHKDNYYLVYLLQVLAIGGTIPLACLRLLVGAALEFRATNSKVDLSIMGPTREEIDSPSTVDVVIELSIGSDAERSKEFAFTCTVERQDLVDLGSRLSSTSVVLPCNVSLGGVRELELTAPIEICAGSIEVKSQSLVLRAQTSASKSHETTPLQENHVTLEAERVKSAVTSIDSLGVQFEVAVEDASGLQYPLVQNMKRRSRPPTDAMQREKYLRLRKILTHFRSHSKGELAKFRDKIENERVAGNQAGRAILNRLVQDEVLTLRGPLYFINTHKFDEFLGISWPDLRRGFITDKLLTYLGSIQI